MTGLAYWLAVVALVDLARSGRTVRSVPRLAALCVPALVLLVLAAFVAEAQKAGAASYLTRIWTDSTSSYYNANVNAKDNICATLPRNGTDQCDEYPFASSLQGGGHSGNVFSIKHVNATQNAKAGNRLVQKYRGDRDLGKYGENQSDPSGDVVLVTIIP